MDKHKEKTQAFSSPGRGQRGARPDHELPGDLRMQPDEMLDLAHKVSELLVERINNLPQDNAWEGEFRQVLDEQIMEEPPEEGRSAAEVIDRGRARNPALFHTRGSPALLRLCAVVAHLARRAGRLHGRRIPRQSMHLARGERPEPPGARRHRLDPALARLPGGRRGAPDQRRLGGQRGCLRRGARSDGQPRTRHRLHERSEPQRAPPRGDHRRHSAGLHPHDRKRRPLSHGHGRACAPGGRRPRCRLQSHRRCRQRRNDEHRRHRPAPSDGRLLRGGGPLAACRRRLRRLRDLDRARQAAAARKSSAPIRSGSMRTSGYSSPTRPAAS